MGLEESNQKSIEDVLSECELGSLGMHKAIHDIINLALEGDKANALAKLAAYKEEVAQPDQFLGDPHVNFDIDTEGDSDTDSEEFDKLEEYIKNEL